MADIGFSTSPPTGTSGGRPVWMIFFRHELVPHEGPVPTPMGPTPFPALDIMDVVHLVDAETGQSAGTLMVAASYNTPTCAP
jgi:hypothetical protein